MGNFKNQKLITLFLILGMAGNYRLTFDNTLWNKLTVNQQFNAGAFDLCLNALGVLIFLSSLFIKASNIKAVLRINLMLIVVLLAGLFGSNLRGSQLIYGFVGASLGTFYFSYIYLMIYGLERKTRSKNIGLILFCAYLVKYISDLFLNTYDINMALSMLLIIYLLMSYVLTRIDFNAAPSAPLNRTPPVPVGFISLLGVIIFLSYFEVFLVGTDSKMLSILNRQEWRWLNQAIHLIICFSFVCVIKKVRYSQTLYFSLLSTIFAYIFSVLPFNLYWLTTIFYSITDSVGDIFLFNLLGVFIVKYQRKPMVLSVIVLFMTLGMIGASFFVNVINENFIYKDILIYGSFLVLFGVTMFFTPFLNRQIEENIEESDPLRVLSTETSMFNHSLKNKVIQISCGIDILKKTQQDANQQIAATLETMSNSVNQMLDVIKNINLHSEAISIVKTSCNLGGIIDDTVKMLKFAVADKEIIFLKKISSDTVFLGDERRIKEVVYNILKNACEAISSTGKIQIEASKKRNRLICQITDDGIGIAEDQIGNVFKPFYSTKKIETNNYGLGLTYCYIVMKRHKGKIEIRSRRDSGTSVCLVFPVQ
jgi:anti-sigma regulatory factor (Ser/Thr protein kinase)